MEKFLSRWFWNSYDFLGRIILANIIVFVILALLLAAAYLLLSPFLSYPIVFTVACLFASIILATPVLAALAHFVHIMGVENQPAMKELWIGFKKYFRRSIALGAIIGLVLVVLSINIWFYTSGEFIPTSYRTFLLVMVGISFWAIVVVFLICLYSIPLMVNQEIGIKKILKRSALMFLDNIFFTIGVFLLILLTSALWIISQVGIILLMFSLGATAMNSAYLTLMEKYEEQEAAQAKQTESDKPTSWKQIIKDEKHAPKKKRKRSLREIFKPWEY